MEARHSYRTSEASGDFCDCYYDVGAMLATSEHACVTWKQKTGNIETNESTYFCPTGSSNFNAACSGCPS